MNPAYSAGIEWVSATDLVILNIAFYSRLFFFLIHTQRQHKQTVGVHTTERIRHSHVWNSCEWKFCWMLIFVVNNLFSLSHSDAMQQEVNFSFVEPMFIYGGRQTSSRSNRGMIWLTEETRYSRYPVVRWHASGRASKLVFVCLYARLRLYVGIDQQMNLSDMNGQL